MPPPICRASRGISIISISGESDSDGTTPHPDDNKLAKALAGTTEWRLVGFEGAAGNFDFPLYRNKSGFSALPAGGRNNEYGFFFDLGEMASWWLATEIDETSAWTRNIFYTNTMTNKAGCPKKQMAYSVRCVQN